MRVTEDSFDAPPWAMQLVVRAEKAAPPAHSAVCAAAAAAVVRLLTDPRAADPEGEWHARVHRWESGRIRKVARRARGVRWPEVQALPGVTVAEEGAEVRAFVPGPVDEVPPELARLQVAGLDLAEDEEPKPPPEPPYAAIALNPDVPMTTGKAAAQSGHAAHLLLREADAPGLAEWIAGGPRVHVHRDIPWRRCVERAAVHVRDAGFTEVPPGTMTAIGWIVTG
ncbi:aminoacyl-tRNA hydrolase [Actinomadura vinacea]|uniref:Aminoacyl-tRNA hydrolase n=1 Tax=Actinomadura vinacea TaxID=115336 RepID=A0ABN3K2L3_9ACTN